jgi:hypothetical protein
MYFAPKFGEALGLVARNTNRWGRGTDLSPLGIFHFRDRQVPSIWNRGTLRGAGKSIGID